MKLEDFLHACPEWKEKIAEAASARTEASANEDLSAHLLVCAGCRSWSEKVELQSKAMASLPRMKAPAILDLRVSEEIHNPEGLAHRWLKRLRRAAAPAELWARMREEISIERAARRSERERLQRWTKWSAAVAACLVVAVGTAVMFQRPKPARLLPLSVRDLNDPSGLSISSSGLIEGVFGAGAPKKKD